MAFGDIKGTKTGTATSITASFACSTGTNFAVVAGDLIVALCAEQAANTVTACTDNLTNTYTALGPGADAGTVAGRGFYSRVTNAGTISSVTFTATASSNNCVGLAVGFEGPFATSPLDASPTTIINDNTTPYTCPATGTLAQANEKIVCAIVHNGNPTLTATSPNAIAVQLNSASVLKAALGHQTVTSTASVTPAFTSSATPTASGYATASFKLAPATGTGTPTAQAADVDGVGLLGLLGTGTPAAQAADVDGTGTVTSVGGDWVTVWEGSSAGHNPDWVGYTIVGVIPLAAFSATGGSQIRLTFYAPFSGEGNEFSAFYVANGGGGDAFDFGETPTQILLGSSSTITLPNSGAAIVSDAVAFVKDASNSLVFSGQFENAAADNIRYQSAITGSGWHYKNAVDAATANKSGYSDLSSSGIPAVGKIELFIGAAAENEGDGALAAQAAAVAGSGETVSTGTAALIAASAEASGAAVSSSDGTGTLPAQSAVASGAAVSSSDGTGLVNAQAAVVAGAGTAAAANSGVLQAQAAVVAAVGSVVATGTGTLPVQAADADGIGISGSYGLGSPSAQASAVAGAGVSSSSGTGSLAAQPAVVAGANVVGPSTGTGTLAVVAAAVAGVGDSSSSGTGAANDNDAAVAGLGQVLWAGTGALVAQSAAVFGSLGLVASGELAASSAAITGAGEAFVTPTLPGQVIVAAADVRQIALAADSRTITAAADSRTITVNADNRVIAAQGDDRILEAA